MTEAEFQDYVKVSMDQVRVYKGVTGYAESLIHLADRKTRVAILAGDEWTSYFRTTHLRHGKEKDGVKKLQDALNIQLPSDFDLFYRTWGWGVLAFRSDFRVFSVKEMVGNYWRRGEPLRPPLALVRFCEITARYSYALRTCDNGAHWDIIIVDPTDPVDDMVVAEREPPVDKSFAEWFFRMQATDGDEDAYDFTPWQAERVPDELALEMFGPDVLTLPEAKKRLRKQ